MLLQFPEELYTACSQHFSILAGPCVDILSCEHVKKNVTAATMRCSAFKRLASGFQERLQSRAMLYIGIYFQ